METKHTPGPWKYSFESIDPRWAIVTAKSGAIVANVNSETGPDVVSAPVMRQMPADANAKLISAAPDLLEACKAALHLLQHPRAVTIQDHVTVLYNDARDTRTIIDAAIAKATGKEEPLPPRPASTERRARVQNSCR